MIGKGTTAMKCPTCGKRVSEPGDCVDCLPFNMYFGDRYTTGRQEQCRQLMLAHRARLEMLPFSQAKVKAGKLTGDNDVQCVVADGIVMLPCLDGSARKSVTSGQSSIAASPRRYRPSNSFDRAANIRRTSRRFPFTLGITMSSYPVV